MKATSYFNTNKNNQHSSYNNPLNDKLFGLIVGKAVAVDRQVNSNLGFIIGFQYKYWSTLHRDPDMARTTFNILEQIYSSNEHSKQVHIHRSVVINFTTKCTTHTTNFVLASIRDLLRWNMSRTDRTVWLKNAHVQTKFGASHYIWRVSSPQNSLPPVSKTSLCRTISL